MTWTITLSARMNLLRSSAQTLSFPREPPRSFAKSSCPFIENTGLTDSLAANEGYRYTWDTKPGIVVRCFVPGSEGKPTEIAPTFHPDKVSVQELQAADVDTDSPPYGMRFAYRTALDVVVDIPTDPIDPRIALPGPVGEMAVYGILENIIRNAAKHGGRDPEETLEVHVVLTDQDSDHYKYAVYENLTGPEEKLQRSCRIDAEAY